MIRLADSYETLRVNQTILGFSYWRTLFNGITRLECLWIALSSLDAGQHDCLPVLARGTSREKPLSVTAIPSQCFNHNMQHTAFRSRSGHAGKENEFGETSECLHKMTRGIKSAVVHPF